MNQLYQPVSKNLTRLREQHKRCSDAILRIQTAASVSGKELTDEDKKDLDSWENLRVGVERDIERECRIVEDERRKLASAPRQKPDRWPGETDEQYARKCRGFGGGEGRIARQGKIGARYADLFGGGVSAEGWESMDAFLTPIHQGLFHPGLQVAALNEASGPSGGYLVPSEYAAEMLDNAIENSIVASRARIYPMNSDVKKVSGFDASTNTSATLFGGIEAQWIGEGDAGTITNPKARKIELKSKKLAMFVSSSNELTEDGLNLESQLDQALRVANAWFGDYAFLRGTGVGQPRGVLSDPALITVDAEAEQDTDTILYENLCNMLARLHPGCFNNAVFVCNPSCIPQLLQLSMPIGVGGVAQPILRETAGGWQLFTRPLLMTEKLPTIGDKGDILLADFSQYAIGVRREITIEKSAHVRFMEDETVWRAISRVDGQGRWNKPFTPANGATQSWCVVLEARA